MIRMLALAALLLAPVAARAQIDPETDKPYDLQVVLRCGAHFNLDKRFRNEFRTNLAGMLTDALGPMANVSVIDLKEVPPEKWSPLWMEVDARGFGALDSAKELSGAKTHFVRVNFAEGQYEVETRQFDGQTGAASVWRREQTLDRAFVARVAGKLIAEDFGLIGTIVGGGSAGEGEAPVRVKFKGAGLGGPLGRWVKAGDVFAVYLVGRAGDKLSAQREFDTLVRITDEPKRGEADAKIYFRYAYPMSKATGGRGLRCVRLGATSGPLRLRLLRPDGQPHTTLQVRVHSQAFQKGQAADEEILNPDRGGLFTSRKSYDHIAFARVITGASLIAKVPVPVQEGREFVTTVSLESKDEELAELQAERVELNRRYLEAALLQKASYDIVKGLVNEQKNKQALERAEKVRNTLNEDLRRLKEEKENARPRLKKHNLDLATADESEQKLERHKDMLNRLIGQLQETRRIEESPANQERKLAVQNAINKATTQIDSDDFDGALKTLNDLLAKYPDEAAVKKQRDELAAKWELQGNEHAQARQWVYETWATAKTAADVQKNLEAAKLKLDILRNVKDKLTLLKFNNSMQPIAKIVANEIVAAGEDAEKKAKLKKTFDDLEKFSQEVNAAANAK